jgi:DNA repair exonuclease SbcCD ATPase subunit
MKPTIYLLLAASLMAVSSAIAQEPAPTAREARPEGDRARHEPVEREQRPPPAAPGREGTVLPPQNRWTPDLERERRAILERVEQMEQMIKERATQMEQAMRERDEKIAGAAREFHARLERLETEMRKNLPQARHDQPAHAGQPELDQARDQVPQGNAMKADLEERMRSLRELAGKLEQRTAELEKTKQRLDQQARKIEQAKQKLDQRARGLEEREHRLNQAEAASREERPRPGKN